MQPDRMIQTKQTRQLGGWQQRADRQGSSASAGKISQRQHQSPEICTRWSVFTTVLKDATETVRHGNRPGAGTAISIDQVQKRHIVTNFSKQLLESDFESLALGWDFLQLFPAELRTQEESRKPTQGFLRRVHAQDFRTTGQWCGFATPSSSRSYIVTSVHPYLLQRLICI